MQNDALRVQSSTTPNRKQPHAPAFISGKKSAALLDAADFGQQLIAADGAVRLTAHGGIMTARENANLSKQNAKLVDRFW